jgi:hypothetical protein
VNLTTQLIKVDSNGVMQWAKTYSEGSKPIFITQTSDSGFTFIAEAQSALSLIKTDSQGNLQYYKNIPLPGRIVVCKCVPAIYNIGANHRISNELKNDETNGKVYHKPSGINCLSKPFNTTMAFRKYFSGKPRTIERGAQNLRQYCDWLKQVNKRDNLNHPSSPEEIITEYRKVREAGVNSHDDWKRETKNLILKFYNDKKTEGYKINACRTLVTGVLAFYSQNMEPIKGIIKQVDPVQIPENDFIFDQSTLRKMYYYGNPFEKTWLSVAVCLGYASQDFLSLETEKIKNLVAEAKDKRLEFITFIGKTRSKTSVQPRSILTPESIHNLTEYIAKLEKDNNILPKLLWKKSSNDNLNDWLKALLKKSNIETYGKTVKFHSIRKFLYDALSKKDETVASVICGKQANVSKLTYKTSLDPECTRIFIEIYPQIALNGDIQRKNKVELETKIGNLEKALLSVETENSTFKTRVEVLQRAQAENSLEIEQLKLEGKENKQKLDLIFGFFEQWRPEAEQQINRMDEAKAEFEASRQNVNAKAQELQKIAKQLEGKKDES